MLTPHAVAELSDPSTGLEQQLLRDQLQDLRREFALLRHVTVQTAAGGAAQTVRLSCSAKLLSAFSSRKEVQAFAAGHSHECSSHRTQESHMLVATNLSC
jgi:hypothetical protein